MWAGWWLVVVSVKFLSFKRLADRRLAISSNRVEVNLDQFRSLYPP